MQENSPKRNEEERLRDENAFLKMKLMLEHGANLSESKDPELPLVVENLFLKSVEEFERKSRGAKPVRIFDKIGRPDKFPPPAEVSDEAINRAWKELRQYLNKYGIDLEVCSPNVSIRELYRFTIEELFQYETDDMIMPGWMTHFIYDEFHPDPVYDNSRIADHVLRMIFRKELFVEDDMLHFRSCNLEFNNYSAISADEFRQLINRFKDCFDDLLLTGKNEVSCTVNDIQCTTKGTYQAEALLTKEKQFFSGSWEMCFEKDEENGYWYINRIRVEDISF
jgi:hypothetical protein